MKKITYCVCGHRRRQHRKGGPCGNGYCKCGMYAEKAPLQRPSTPEGIAKNRAHQAITRMRFGLSFDPLALGAAFHTTGRMLKPKNRERDWGVLEQLLGLDPDKWRAFRAGYLMAKGTR